MAEFGYIPGRSKSRIYLLISSVNGKFGYSLRPRKWLSLATYLVDPRAEYIC